MTSIRKGMILAAGLGTRLLPITDQIPKPLVPVLNLPNLLHSLRLLENAGIEEVILNLHYLPAKIESFFRTCPTALKVHFSHEPVLLGTGGGVKKAESFFAGESFVLLNCDFVSDVALSPFIEQHLERRALATMLLYENKRMQPLYSKVGVSSSGHLASLPAKQIGEPARTGIFTGVHILEGSVFKWLKETPSGINETLYPYLMQNHPERVYGEFLQRQYWHDTGDIPAFLNASFELLSSLQQQQAGLVELLQHYCGSHAHALAGIWTHPSVSLPSGALAPVLIGANTKIDGAAVLGPQVIVGEGCEIAAGARLSRVVVLPGSRVPSGNFSEGIFFKDKLLSAKAPA